VVERNALERADHRAVAQSGHGVGDYEHLLRMCDLPCLPGFGRPTLPVLFVQLFA
jgi:hypothetical protein